MMKKVFFLINLLIFLAAGNIAFAGPFYTPSFNFLPDNKLLAGIKEIYTRENDFGLENVQWRSDIAADFYYGINKNLELDLSFPYTSGSSAGKQSGLRDSLFYLKYRIYSNQGELCADRDWDVLLQLGGKVKTGEIKKDLGGRETDLLCALMGRYEIGRWKSDYYFYFHLGEWFPVDGDYKYKNIFQYDFAVECRPGEKVSVFLESNGEKTSSYDLIYIGPGIHVLLPKDWEMKFAFCGSISDKGGFMNSKSGISILKKF